ncbi:MAG: metallophosphoesterase [Phycisphaerales bacterium]|nr:metallophosphoesterase [Phycisphaerales bacterium]
MMPTRGLLRFVVPVVLVAVPAALVVTACSTNRPALRSHENDAASSLVRADAASSSDDAFTVIFIGDPEARMRGNTHEEISGYVQRLLDLGDTRHEWFRLGDGRTHEIDPEIVIVGGDISQDRHTSIELDMPLWAPFFEAGIPVLAGFGNHDWEPESWGDSPSYSLAGHRSNESTTAFTRETYRRSAEISPNLAYREIGPTAEHGPVTFHATYKGVDIVNFNTFLYQPSYEYPAGWPITCNPLGGGAGCQTFVSAVPQIEAMESLLAGDASTPTIFVQHYPLSTSDGWWDDYETTDTTLAERKQRLLNMIARRAQAVFLAGHNHRSSQRTWPVGDQVVDEYVAPYFGDGGGVIAVLVSPTRGILEVRTLRSSSL